MAISRIPVTTGTGPKIAVDVVGTDNYQVFKVDTGGLGTTGLFDGTISISTGTVDVISMPLVTVTASANPLSVVVNSITTGTMNIAAGTLTTVLALPVVTVTASANPLIVSTVASVLAMPVVVVTASANPLIVSTVSTVLTMPVLSATNITIASITAGTVNISSGTITTVLAMPVLSATGITVASITALGMFQAGGAVIASGTGTGPLVMGIQTGATLGRPILVTTTGAQICTVDTVLGTAAVTAANITIASITAGTISAITPFQVGGAVIASGTGTGPLVMGIQTGATLGRPICVTTTGAVIVSYVTTQAVTVANVLSATGVLLAATTANVGAFVMTAHASRFQAFIVCVTSAAAGTIIRAAAANTIYVVDVNISASGAGLFTLMSDATAMFSVYIAATTSFNKTFWLPVNCTTAQSLRLMCPSASSHYVQVVGYTVT